MNPVPTAAAANPPRQCPKCDTELRDAVLGGQCPLCMLNVMRDPDATVEMARSSPLSGFPRARAGGGLRYIGDYEIGEEIGRGGMGVVFKARHLSLHRTVALKVISPEQLASPRAVERFHTEAAAAASLDHPNIVPVYETGECDGWHYFSMKLIEGRSLAEAMPDMILSRPPASRMDRKTADRAQSETGTRSGKTTGRQSSVIAILVRQIATAVHYAHQHGILHRDLKPGNILIDAAGEPHVADFGLARQMETGSSLTISGEIMGTPAYMAPEQAGGMVRQITTASDVFSLGSIFYELLTGRTPFRAETAVETLHAVLHHDPATPRSLNPAVPRDLETICLKCLQKEPVKRYASALELAEECGRFLRGEPIQARPVSTPEKVWRWCRRKPALAASLLLLWIVLMLGVAGILWQWQRAEQNATQAQANAAEMHAKDLAIRDTRYAGDIGVAHQAVESRNLRLAATILRNQIPQAGEPDLRGFEWRYLWQQSQGDELFSLQGSSTAVSCLAFSPDRTILAVGSDSGSTRIWELSSRRLLAKLHPGEGANDTVSTIEYSPAGDVLVAATKSGVWLYDTKTWEVHRRLPDSARKARFSPDGRFLVSTTKQGLLLWDAHTGGELKRIDVPRVEGGTSSQTAFVISRDSTFLAAASKDGILLVSLPDFQQTGILPDAAAANHRLAFSPVGHVLATIAPEGKIKFWDTVSRQQTTTLSVHPDSDIGLAFSPDGQQLATCSADQTVKLWNTASGALIRTFHGHGESVSDVSFSPDGKLLASGSTGGEVKVWDVFQSPDRGEGMIENAFPMGFDDAGNLITSDDKTKLSWINPDTSRIVHSRFFSNHGGEHADYSMLGFDDFGGGHMTVFSLQLPVSGTQPAKPNHDDYADRMELWDLSAGKYLCSLESGAPWGSPSIRYKGFAPKAGLFAASTSNGDVVVWNVPDGKVKFTLPGAGLLVSCASDGSLLATWNKTGGMKFKFWDLRGESPRLLGSSDQIDELIENWYPQGFSPDGRSLALSRKDGSIFLFSVPDGRLINKFSGHGGGEIIFSFPPDGRTLASAAADDTVRLWHVASGRQMLQWAQPPRRNGAATPSFSPEGRTLAVFRQFTGGNFVRWWTAPSFAEIAVAEGKDYQTLIGEDPAIWLATGRALAKRKRDEEALAVFAKVIQFCVDHPDSEALRAGALRNRSELLTRLGRMAEAGADNCTMLNLPVRDPQAPAARIDLSRHFNESLDERKYCLPSLPFLEGLPHGVQALRGADGVQFDLRGAIRLGDTYPDSVEGIPVRQKCRRLHILHAGGGGTELEPDNTQVASYLLHYTDGSQEEIPVRYGQDLRSWVVKDDPADIRGAKVAWTGIHSQTGAIRIFMQTWENPHPDIELKSVDFVSKKTKCVPILFGITVEP